MRQATGRGLLCVLALSGCASAPRADLRTGVRALSPGWTAISDPGATIALHHVDGGAIAATVQCDATDEDAPLDVLVNHVLLQLEAPVEQDRRSFVVDGRGALRVRLSARLDGVPIMLDLVVVKKDGCVIDAQLVGAPADVAARRVDFERFFAGLAIARRSR